MEELLSLKWNNHRSTFLHILTILRDKQLYTDATLACEGRFYSVHRLVLSTCSDYFSAMFDRTTCKNPIIVLKDIKCEDLEALLDYMYLGEVNVRQADLASLIKAAECLRVKGLAVPDDEPPRKGGRSDSNKVRNSDVGHSPPSKRKRREVCDDVRPSSSTPKTTQSQSRLSPLTQVPLETSQATSNQIQSSDSSHTNNIDQSIENQTFVKMEMEDSGGGDDIGGAFNVTNDGFKEEEGDEIEDPGGELSNDLPEFLQQATGSHSSFSHGSFAGTSSFQPGDIGWQGESSNLNFPGHLNFSPTDSSSQNATGVSANTSSLPAALSSSEPLGGGNFTATSCLVCGKNFHSMWHMTRHLRTHTGERPFPCPFCPYRATQKNALQRHIQNVHGMDTGALMPCGIGGSKGGMPVLKAKRKATSEDFPLPTSPTSKITSFAALLDSHISESSLLPFTSGSKAATLASTATTSGAFPSSSQMASLPSFSRALSNMISNNSHSLSSVLLSFDHEDMLLPNQ